MESLEFVCFYSLFCVDSGGEKSVYLNMVNSAKNK